MNKSKIIKFVVLGVIVLIFLGVLASLFGEYDGETLVITTRAEVSYATEHIGTRLRTVRLYTPLELGGYMSTATGRATHHLYIGQLEDSYIFIWISQANTGGLSPDSILRVHGEAAIVEGTVFRSSSHSDFRTMRNRFLRDWDMEIEEFYEIFTPYLLRGRFVDPE